jgi:hypothetical protein
MSSHAEPDPLGEAMPIRNVAISMGSTRSTTVELPGLRLSDICFPPDALLDTHTHDRPVFAVALEGALDARLPGRVQSQALEPGTQRHDTDDIALLHGQGPGTLLSLDGFRAARGGPTCPCGRPGHGFDARGVLSGARLPVP